MALMMAEPTTAPSAPNFLRSSTCWSKTRASRRKTPVSRPAVAQPTTRPMQCNASPFHSITLTTSSLTQSCPRRPPLSAAARNNRQQHHAVDDANRNTAVGGANLALRNTEANSDGHVSVFSDALEEACDPAPASSAAHSVCTRCPQSCTACSPGTLRCLGQHALQRCASSPPTSAARSVRAPVTPVTETA